MKTLTPFIPYPIDEDTFRESEEDRIQIDHQFFQDKYASRM